MRVNTLLLFACLSIMADSFCQSTDENDVRDITTFTLLMPGVSYEKHIANYQTIYARAFAGLSFFYSYSSYLGDTFGIKIHPSIDLEYRFYYNFKRREAKDKQTAMNSANYIGFIYSNVLYRKKIYFPNDDVDYKYELRNTVGVVWGLQRNYNNGLSLNLKFGPGYSFGKEHYLDEIGHLQTLYSGNFAFIIRCNLGIWLDRRR